MDKKPTVLIILLTVLFSFCTLGDVIDRQAPAIYEEKLHSCPIEF